MEKKIILAEKEINVVQPAPVNLNKGSRIEFHLVKGHTIIVGIDTILPEDGLWRKENPRTPAMICLEQDNVCGCPMGCIPKLVLRCRSLFEALPSAKQMLILFRREEALLKRKISAELTADMDKELLASIKTEAPRIIALIVHRDFEDRKVPYRLQRVNYDGLKLSLAAGKKVRAEVPMSFW